MDEFFDFNKYLSLGFTHREINGLKFLRDNNVSVTPQRLRELNFTEFEIKRICKLDRIISGKVEVNSDREISNHFRSMSGTEYRLSSEDLRTRERLIVPRKAVIFGIKEEPFSFWNSNNFKGSDKLYNVIKSDSQKITISTKKRPVIKAGDTMNLEGKIKIKGITTDGKVILEVNRKCCKLCNRYGVVIEKREPLNHYGSYKIIAYEGTIFYISLVELGDGNKNRARYSNTGKLLAYGFMWGDAKNLLDKVVKENASRVSAVKISYLNATDEYHMIEHNEMNSN